jgi:hypothetical protein
MMTVFVGGSRRISRLNDTIKSRADNIIRQELRVLIGDANGTDKAMQQYFAAKGYKNVVVYCMGNRCRNNLGNWPTRQISAERNTKDFTYYATKDLEMAKEASCGFMIWDGKSKGTLNNILNLLLQHKKVVVYFAPDKASHTLRSMDDLRGLLGKCSSTDRQKFERELSVANLPMTEKPYPDLFSARRD